MLILNAAFLSIVGMLGRIDPLAVAAHAIGLRIQSLAFVPGMSISQDTAAMVGQALGASDVERAKRVTRAAVILTTSLMTSLSLIIFVLEGPILEVFGVSGSGRLADLSITWIRLLGVGFPLVGSYVAFSGTLQGSGATGTSLRINAAATLLFQIPLSFVLGFPLGLAEFGIWLAFPLSFIVKTGLGVAAYRRGDWARVGKNVRRLEDLSRLVLDVVHVARDFGLRHVCRVVGKRRARATPRSCPKPERAHAPWSPKSRRRITASTPWSMTSRIRVS